MTNIDIITTGDTFYPGMFDKINNNFTDLNNEKIEIEGEKTELSILDDFLIIDSEDQSKTKTINYNYVYT